jgi:NAD-dependent dihydropyrimidine dehydrogenase PreA subunit
MIFIDEKTCTGCGLCLDACAQGAIALGESGATIDQSLCAGCAACVAACPQAAIYEVEAAPLPIAAVSTEAQPTPGPLARWQPTITRARPAIASTLAAAAPLAVEALSSLVRTWLDERNTARIAGGGPAPGRGGCRRRRQRGRRC